MSYNKIQSVTTYNIVQTEEKKFNTLRSTNKKKSKTNYTRNRYIM